ncbi:hypothetical protein D3C80_1922700 [compost metagenome]
MVPLAAAIDDLATLVEFHGAANAGGVAHLLQGLGRKLQRLVVQLVRRLDLICGHEAVEITLLGQTLVERLRFLAVGLGQLQAACLPVTPAVGLAQFCRHLAGQLVCVVPAAEA